MVYNIKYKLKVLLKKYKDCESEEFKDELRILIYGLALKLDIDINISNDNFYIIDSWEDCELMEKSGFDIDLSIYCVEWGFNDEYSTCDICFNVIHTQPYRMHDFSVLDCELFCGDCIRDDEDIKENYIRTLVNNPKSANTILDNEVVEELGFLNCLCDDSKCSFDNGLYAGCNDDPVKILASALKSHPDYEFIFSIIDVHMFNTNFTLYHRNKTS